MLKFFLPFAMALTLAGAQSSSNAQSSNQNTPPSYRWHATQNQKANLSMKAEDMLWQTDRALDAVKSQNKQVALDHLNKAVTDMAQIRNTAPNQTIVPIYTELEQTSYIGPLMAARHMNNNTGGSSSGSADRARSGVAVRDVTGDLTLLAVDVNMANGHLQAAQHAVQQGDWNAAASALNAVRDGVFLASVSTDMPLFRARENLALARDAAASNDWKDVHSALTAASHALSEYERSGATHAQDAKNMQQQIDSYNQTVAQNHPDAVNQIETWWNNTTNWMTQASASSQQGRSSTQNR